jgi:type IX secretion system PorP/SprF family membrane protein
MKDVYSKRPTIFRLKNIIGWKKLVLPVVMILKTVLSPAQDIQYSQFYANVLYLNPAFAGSAHGLRGIAHQRFQWPSLDAKYLTTSFSLDNYFKKTRSGLGITFMKDWQGSSTISSTEVTIQYSQEIVLTQKHFIRAGAELGYASRYINYSILNFPDQFTNNGFTNTTTDEPFGASKVNYFDASVGAMFYSDKYWFGLSAHHLNQPDQSFYGNGSPLPAKIDMIAGYKILFRGDKNTLLNFPDREVYVTPTMYYKFQGKSDQVDFGLYGIYEHVMAGIWYRGIPVKHYNNETQNNESMVILAGWKINALRISYSYDFTVSKLQKARTGGAHELNITYVVEIPKRKKIMKKLPCPDF